MSENDHFSCIDFNFSGDLDWRRAWSHVNYDTGGEYCNFVFFNYADVCRFSVLLLILVAGAGVCYISLFYQNGNNQRRGRLFWLHAGNVTFVYSDLYYYVEIRKLRVK